MEKLTRIKQYKADKPERTITKIRSILCEKLNLILEEENFKSEGDFYSTRIRIGNYSLSTRNFGTNGKGMSFAYALASAHGEFMERIENQALIRTKELAYKNSSFVRNNIGYSSFLKRNNLLLDFRYAPDEKQINITSENIDDILKNVFVSNKERVYQEYQGKLITLLPFYNLTKREVTYLPYDIIFHNCTSNGMCAGNTPKEAIIQGISEIIERFILREIYTKELSLPTIPNEYFAETDILSKIDLLKEKYGSKWKFLIKDCSLGKNYPGIGILMLNIEERKYLFHLGVDPCPITALERSLTEIYQGREVAAILNIDYSHQTSIMNNPSTKDAEFYKTCTTGTGHYPISILKEPCNSKFTGFDRSWGVSDDEDLRKLACLLEKDGYEIFIRDVSFLEFPAYCIYVPGITEFRNIIKKDFNYTNIHLRALATKAATDLRNASIEEIKALIESVKNEPKYVSEITKYDSQSFLIKYDKTLIIGFLYIAIGKYKDAYDSISTYYNRFVGTTKEKMFFSALKDVLYCKCKNIDYKELSLFYDEKSLMMIKAFIENREFLNYIPYTNIKNCDWDIYIKTHPDFIGILHLMKRLENEYKKHIPNQEKLQDLLK